MCSSPPEIVPSVRPVLCWTDRKPWKETKRSLCRQDSPHHFNESNNCATVQSPPPCTSSLVIYTQTVHSWSCVRKLICCRWPQQRCSLDRHATPDDQDDLASKPKHYTINNRPIQLMAVNVEGIWSRQCGLSTTSDWCATHSHIRTQSILESSTSWHSKRSNDTHSRQIG